MIDIHTHILPGVDDGASDLFESLEMARLAVADGITQMFATPHHRDCTPLTRFEVAQRLEKLQGELTKADIPLKLVAGHEVRLYDDVLQDWEQELAGPLGNTSYVLAEPLFHSYSKRTEAILFELIDRGYIPILAHPERIFPIQENLALIEPVLERGALVQLTAGSITSDRDWRAHRAAVTLLRQGMVHIIASDAHKPYRRRPILSRARAVAAQIVGAEQADALVTGNPQAVLENRLILAPTVSVGVG